MSFFKIISESFDSRKCSGPRFFLELMKLEPLDFLKIIKKSERCNLVFLPLRNYLLAFYEMWPVRKLDVASFPNLTQSINYRGFKLLIRAINQFLGYERSGSTLSWLEHPCFSLSDLFPQHSELANKLCFTYFKAHFFRFQFLKMKLQSTT